MLKRVIIIVSSILVTAIALAVAIPFISFGVKSNVIKTDWTYLKEDKIYNSKVEVNGIELVTQHISCGYATIEMMSNFYGSKITEDELSDKNGGGISTSTSKGFLNELKSSVPSKEFVEHTYLHNDMLLKEVYISLKNNNPVALEWAAKYKNEWTLHFSLISALDLSMDNVTIYNPYGYIENISIGEFLNRSTFEAFENMPLFYNFGFAYGAFSKNTIFYSK